MHGRIRNREEITSTCATCFFIFTLHQFLEESKLMEMHATTTTRHVTNEPRFQLLTVHSVNCACFTAGMQYEKYSLTLVKAWRIYWALISFKSSQYVCNKINDLAIINGLFIFIYVYQIDTLRHFFDLLRRRPSFIDSRHVASNLSVLTSSPHKNFFINLIINS